MAYSYLQEISEGRFTEATIREMYRLVDAGKRDPAAQKLVYGVVNRALPGQWKDYEREIATWMQFLKSRVDYRRDPHDVELLQDLWATLDRKRGDCIPLDEKIIVRSRASKRYEVIPVGSLRESYTQYEALSYNFEAGRWEFRAITNWVYKGKKPVFRVRMGNGTSFRATGDHKLFSYDQRSAHKLRNGGWKYAACRKNRPFEIKTLNELNVLSRVHPSLAMASRIPCLDAIPDRKEDALWVHGLYVAEGWVSVKPSGRISKIQIGGDGAVREELAARLEKMGVPFSKSKREVSSSINLLEGDFKDELRCDIVGRYAYEKDLPEEFLSLGLEQVRAFLGGYGIGDDFVPTHGDWLKRVERVHNTTSLVLAKKLMFFNRLLGKPCSLWTQKKHGGAGKTPMYRVLIWKRSGRRNERYRERIPGVTNASVKEIVPCGEEPVCDITVEGTHNFVLENGVVAHNCDDFVIAFCTGSEILGAPCRMVTVSTKPDRKPSHVYAQVQVGGRWQGADLIVQWATLGWEPTDGITDRKIWTRSDVGLSGDTDLPMEGLGMRHDAGQSMPNGWASADDYRSRQSYDGMVRWEGNFADRMYEPVPPSGTIQDGHTFAPGEPGTVFVRRGPSGDATKYVQIPADQANVQYAGGFHHHSLPMMSNPTQHERQTVVDSRRVPDVFDKDLWTGGPVPPAQMDWDFTLPRPAVSEESAIVDLAGFGIDARGMEPGAARELRDKLCAEYRRCVKVCREEYCRKLRELGAAPAGGVADYTLASYVYGDEDETMGDDDGEVEYEVLEGLDGRKHMRRKRKARRRMKRAHYEASPLMGDDGLLGAAIDEVTKIAMDLVTKGDFPSITAAISKAWQIYQEREAARRARRTVEVPVLGPVTPTAAAGVGVGTLAAVGIGLYLLTQKKTRRNPALWNRRRRRR